MVKAAEVAVILNVYGLGNVQALTLNHCRPKMGGNSDAESAFKRSSGGHVYWRCWKEHPIHAYPIIHNNPIIIQGFQATHRETAAVSPVQVARTLQPATRSILSGGVHVAVEICGTEWSYGWSGTDEIGIFSHEPRKCPQHRFVQAIYLGDCKKTPQEGTGLEVVNGLWLKIRCDLWKWFSATNGFTWRIHVWFWSQVSNSQPPGTKYMKYIELQIHHTHFASHGQNRFNTFHTFHGNFQAPSCRRSVRS